jgi:hypothetical protein
MRGFSEESLNPEHFWELVLESSIIALLLYYDLGFWVKDLKYSSA